eukprot:CAMPEP_0194214126 /NCGR_PEP_ID=MMETSP0156-20130528/15206_1 /TAXON_ID=33649 /ORGANISM="Thalassionema nitzschioides, Strain L26-B" /LENGTH=230 /DNA_ID=CAMNT_0038942323 /DNA_START=60 /DNA_END=752 /DNA_ORIENTATION=-
MNSIAAPLASLSRFHPIVIEGMGYYDPRDPVLVAKQVASQLKRHLVETQNCNKPLLVITQGDPLNERGISAITPLVAQELNVSRGLVCLDDHLDPNHSKYADRDNVILEFRYSQLVEILEEEQSSSTSVMTHLEEKIDSLILSKNNQRQELGKAPLKDYFKVYALLQEVTKASIRKICGDLTVAHTADDISEFSVTSFYTVGLELGLVEKHRMVPYGVMDYLDFDQIDKR